MSLPTQSAKAGLRESARGTGERPTLRLSRDAPEENTAARPRAAFRRTGGTISDRLALALDGLPAQRLAELTGFNHETVRRYLSGQRPSARFVSTVCQRFGLNAHWVLLGEGQAWNSTELMAELSMVPTREIGEEIAARLKKM